MNIYGTLPKTTAYSMSGGVNGSANHSSDFEMMNAVGSVGGNGIGGAGGGGGGSRAGMNTSNGGYNTLGSYRVQYASTNPFLQGFNGGGANGAVGNGLESGSSGDDKFGEE